MNDTSLLHETHVIFRRLEDPFPLRFLGEDLSGWYWLAILIPVGLLALLYVFLMYRKDARTIGWGFAGFLALLRCSVYVLLALGFLLPANQTTEESKLHSKVLVLFDGSLSMAQIKDDLPTASTPAETLPARIDKVVQLLLRSNDDPKNRNQKTSFLQALESKNPVYCYRFGSQLDPEYTVQENGVHLWKEQVDQNVQEQGKSQPDKSLIAGVKWERAQWLSWLKPDLARVIPLPGPNATDEERKKNDEVRALLQRDQIWFNSTNVGGSVLELLKREGNNMVQGIVVFTDGRSTEESPQAYRDLAEIARQKKIPIFAVKIGEDRPKIEIDIADLRVPEQARPDDTYPVTVEVRAKGLRSEAATVYLDIYKPTNDEKAEGQLKEKFKTLEAQIKFSERDPLQAEAKFEIDPAEFGEPATGGSIVPTPSDKPKPGDANPKPPGGGFDKPVDRKQFLLRRGQWQFVARVAKDQREIFVGKEHVTEPAVVKVEPKALRVLLFASAPTRDYQFVRTLFVREKNKGRLDLSIYVQPPPGQKIPRNGVVQDVEAKRLLQRFPNYFQDPKRDTDETFYYNLANYDIVIAFDPDWTQLETDELEKVQKWVEAGGGLIGVGGAVNTIQMARPGPLRDRLKPIRDVYPVELQDSRIQDLERPTSEPFRLNFDPKKATPDMEFLNLDDTKEAKEPGETTAPRDQYLRGWEEFFTGQRDKSGDKTELIRGFYNFYPVEKAKRGSIILATFSDKRGMLKSGEEQPFLVVNPVVGRGKTIWIGSGETWRLRQYRETYHERFWTKLARYAGSGNYGKQNSRVVPYIGKRFPANSMVHIEAQIRGLDQEPLPQNARPRLTIRPPDGSDPDAKKKPDETTPRTADAGRPKGRDKEYKLTPKLTTEKWNGWFEADFPVREAGKYVYELEIKETGEVVSGTFEVKPANPELDNTSPDTRSLYFDLASDAGDVLKRVDPDVNKELKERLQRPIIGEVKDRASKPADPRATARDPGLRLYFDLNNADLIPKCMGADQKTQVNRGAVEDLWPGRCELFGMDTSWTLLLVVGLLSAEWLTRKLLRLA